MRVLLVRGASSTAPSVDALFANKGSLVRIVTTDEDWVELAKMNECDLIVLDLDAGDTSSFRAIETMRDAGVDAPVLVTSENRELETKLRCFRSGADDYVTKPFDNEELIARASAVARRGQPFAKPVLNIGKLKVHLDAQFVETDAGPVKLTGREFKALEILGRLKGQVVTKEKFIHHMYPTGDAPEAKIIDVYISQVRKKLSAATGGEKYIHTVWGSGYVMRAPKSSEIGHAA